MTPPSPHTAESPSLLPWIIAFKAVKSTLLFILAVTFIWSSRHDPLDLLTRAAGVIHLPWLSALLERAIQLVADATPRKEVAAGVVAFSYSGLMGSEGVALYLRKTWAPVFTVIATSSLVPIELFEIVREPTVGRIALLVVNLAAVWYLWTRREAFR